MAESAEASELADDSIDRSEPEDEEDDGEDEVDEDGDDEDDDENPERESEEEQESEEEEEKEELTGKARFEKRDSDSDTDSLPSVPDGSPLPSDYDSDAEPEPEPEHEGPPAYVIPQQLAGKKLVVAVHELRGLPPGTATACSASWSAAMRCTRRRPWAEARRQGTPYGNNGKNSPRGSTTPARTSEPPSPPSRTEANHPGFTIHRPGGR